MLSHEMLNIKNTRIPLIWKEGVLLNVMENWSP